MAEVDQLEQSCPECERLRAASADAAQKYAELVAEQAAQTNRRRAELLDPLIETAFQRRNATRAAAEFHRFLAHGKKPRTMTAGS